MIGAAHPRGISRRELRRVSLGSLILFLKGSKFPHPIIRIGSHACNHTVPYGTVLSKVGLSKHFVPGYDRIVLSGTVEGNERELRLYRTAR
jgi:hypothetical protein